MSIVRIFQTAEEVEKTFNDYLESLKRKGYSKQVVNSKTGSVETLTVPKPPTVEGFSLFAGIDPRSIYRYNSTIDEEINPNTGRAYTEQERDVIVAVFRVYTAIKDDHIGGGLNQQYNGGLVARLHAIADSANINQIGSGTALNITISSDDLKLK